MALGTSALSLMEMTSAFAAVAHGSYPVRPRGLPTAEDDSVGSAFEGSVRRNMMELLWAVTHQGTGRGAALAVPTFGKTGTSQESRDAYFIGFAGDLVTGVWIGRDDNKPVGDVQGGGLPARIWKSFMAEAVKNAPAPAVAVPVEVPVAGNVMVAPMGDPTAPAFYDVGEYDVDDSPAPLPQAAAEDAGPLPPPEDEVPADEPPPGDDGPPAPAEIPTITPPPAPPTPEDEPPPQGSE
jgi:penicillin-binding protein 1A